MADKRTLTNREWYVDGTWYDPINFIKDKFQSVVYCKYYNTSSSAGDWSGLIIQKLNGKLLIINFSQENNYPSSGFDVITGDVLIECNAKDAPPSDYPKIFENACNAIYS